MSAELRNFPLPLQPVAVRMSFLEREEPGDLPGPLRPLSADLRHFPLPVQPVIVRRTFLEREEDDSDSEIKEGESFSSQRSASCPP